MPRVIAYHPEFLVVKGKELFSIHVDLDDWYNDEEVLNKLAAWTGVRTMGEAVVAIRGKKFATESVNILSARISIVGTEHVVTMAANGRPVLKWDDAIVPASKWV